MNRRWFGPCLTLMGLASSLLEFPTSALAADTLAVLQDPPDEGKETGSAVHKSKGTGVFLDNKDLEMEDSDDLGIEAERSGTERITNSISVQGGFAYRKGPGFGLELGWHLDEDRLIELKVESFKTSDADHFSDLKLENFLVQSKIFMNNSLFFTVGAGISKIKVEGTENLTTAAGAAETYAYKGAVNQTLLALSAGNQWQTGGWTWGVDWLKLYLPFSVSISSSKIETTGTSAELRRIKNENDLKAESWNIDYGIGIYGGYAF